MRVGRLLAIAGALAAAWFAIQGGEYSTWDLLRQRKQKARLQAQLDSLTVFVDSLRKYERAVRTDPATQERIAREEFGMVRGNKEIIYRFADTPDTISK